MAHHPIEHRSKQYNPKPSQAERSKEILRGSSIPAPRPPLPELRCGGQVAVIDEFPAVSQSDNIRGEGIDVNHDGFFDLTHGELVTTLLEDHGLTVHRFSIRTYDDITKQLHELGDRIERGESCVDAVNLSMEWRLTRPKTGSEPVSFQILRDLTGIPTLSPDNIASQRAVILKKLETPQVQVPAVGAIGEINSAIKRLVDLGVKVYLPAGNDGPDYVNLLGLSEGVTQVAATDANGKLLPNSADNSLVTRKAQGIFGVRRTAAGLDLDGNGTTDISRDFFLSSPTLAERVVGKKVTEVARHVPKDFEKSWQEHVKQLGTLESPVGEKFDFLFKSLPPGIYSVREIAGKIFDHPDYPNKLAQQFGEYVDNKLNFSFSVDRKGRLVFDPERSGKKGQISSFEGSSFAVPMAIAEDLKRPQQSAPKN